MKKQTPELRFYFPYGGKFIYFFVITKRRDTSPVAAV
jgi:hypothetical protein